MANQMTFLLVAKYGQNLVIKILWIKQKIDKILEIKNKTNGN